MAITATDILYKFSVAAAAGNTTAGTAAGSLGDQISTTEITSALLHNLFDVVTGDENAASDVEYRCFFVHNNHATLTWENAVVWVSANVAGGANVALGVDPAAASAIGAATQQASISSTEGTVPTPAVTFTDYAAGSAIDVKARGLSVGSLTAGQCRAIWVRRTAANNAALNNDGCTITVEGDTAA